MDKINIKEIAKKAFVSRSVVSRVLNNHKNVSDEARARVKKVINKYNYRPSTVARGLAKNQSYEIGIVAPRRSNEGLGNGFWSLLHLGIFEEFIQKGYFVTMSPIAIQKGAKINEYILDHRRLDGYILLTQEVSDIVIESLNERSIPIVLVGHSQSNSNIISIDVDNFVGAWKATNYLISLGHQNIGIILGDKTMIESQDRLEGYREALNEVNIKVNESLTAVGDYSQKTGYKTAINWLKKNINFSAIFCASDTIAMGALLGLHEKQVSVPKDVAVIGFDNLPFSEYTIPPLTTIRQPIYEKGKRAAQLLIQQIENEKKEVIHENLDPTLIIRESCST